MNLHLRLEKTDSDEDTDMVQDCLLTATFSNVLPQSTAAMVSGYTPPYAPTQMVLTLRGSLRHTETEDDTLEGNRAKRIVPTPWSFPSRWRGRRICHEKAA